jgi:hypothetical protein
MYAPDISNIRDPFGSFIEFQENLANLWPLKNISLIKPSLQRQGFYFEGQ